MGISLGPSHKQFTAWLSRIWNGTEVGLYAGGQPHLMPTCFAVLAAECSNLLDELPAERRQSVAKYIQAKQIGDTGLFADGAVALADTTSHSPTYLYLQHTYFALHALDALGATPMHSLHWAEKLKEMHYTRGWLDGGPWHNPWHHSNNVMFALSMLQHLNVRNDDQDALDAFDGILDYLDERQDRVTGMWQPDGGRDDRNAVYAAYHFFPFYFWRGRAPNYTERIVDCTLGIQADDGFYYPGGGACEDLDAVHTLVMMALRSGYRADEVRSSLMRCARVILEHQNPDGGYSNYSHRRERFAKRFIRLTGADRRLLRRDLLRRDWRYSGWKVLTCPITSSDMWSAWFRPLTLLLIAELYPEDFSDVPRAAYRRKPGLGWHDAGKIRDAVGSVGTDGTHSEH